MAIAWPGVLASISLLARNDFVSSEGAETLLGTFIGDVPSGQGDGKKGDSA